MLFIKGNHPVVEGIGGYQCIFAVIELSKCVFGVSVNDSLLIDAPHSFDRAYVVGVLREQVASTLTLNNCRV